MPRYLALLRGINVGGNAMIKMAELKIALEKAGFTDVSTYIQSGNVFFSSNEKDTTKLALKITDCIQKKFKLTVGTAVFTEAQWKAVIKAAPAWWGKDTSWKHNILVLLEPYNLKDAVAAVGELKPDIEAMEPGKGVLYQSVSFKFFGRTTTGKLASNPIYKKMTIRNYNTATKLVNLF